MRPKLIRTVLFIHFIFVIAASSAFGQRLASPVIDGYRLPDDLHLRIVKAEDARDPAPVVEMLTSANSAVRYRGALAAGRIGDELAITRLATLLEDRSAEVRAMAAFALGEIESLKAADAILRALGDKEAPDTVRARLVEAAGKIAAANLGPPNSPASSRDLKVTELGEAILDVLDAEEARRDKQNKLTVVLGLTAALRSRPEGSEPSIAQFLTNLDARIRADAANSLARLRARNSNMALRAMLMNDDDPVARANAARALGAADDKESIGILIDAASGDEDSRVRVSAIRSLATLRDAKAADPLLKRGEELLLIYAKAKKPNYIPIEHNEFVEIATALGQLIPNSFNERAIRLFREFGKIDRGHTSEVYVARVRVAPARGDGDSPELNDWKQYRTLALIVGEFAVIQPTTDEGKRLKEEAPGVLRPLALAFAEADPAKEGKKMLAAPDVLRAFARFKTDDLREILQIALKNPDVYVRAAAASLLADLPAERGTRTTLERALVSAMSTDTRENDAQLALLEAIAKVDGAGAVDTLYKALDAPDYLVRKKTIELLNDAELLKKQPGARLVVANAKLQNKNRLFAYDKKLATRLGQTLNTDIDYRRALARKNGTVRAVFSTQKGSFTIDLLPEDAPLTVDNFVKLARSGYFNGLEVHRVVPNFVMQDGDPIGNGSGGPGWSIRCEVNMVPYERGVVGMALSGKDTGGSQWFVTHAPQPHLDGGYTVFGKVNETGMKVVDKIVRGDKILSVRIIGR
ncbi:MAG TPA: peptidylprolyl isomerase [Pyrinomonadaceae bacterium]|nr:peptidylprolyl isomerase [Pyrinomonadaceae bacterium]